MLGKNYSFIEIDDNVLIDEVRRVNIYNLNYNVKNQAKYIYL